MLGLVGVIGEGHIGKGLAQRGLRARVVPLRPSPLFEASVNPLDIGMMLALGAVLYFLILRPQAQERAAHEDLLQKLAKDDHVVTSSGLHGKVVEVSEELVVLEVGSKTRITFDKAAVSRRQGEPRKPT